MRAHNHGCTVLEMKASANRKANKHDHDDEDIEGKDTPKKDKKYSRSIPKVLHDKLSHGSYVNYDMNIL